MKKFSVLLILFMSTLIQAQVVVVVSKNSPIENLDNQNVANIFLAKTKRFPNGDRATPIELKNNQTQSQFYHGISGKTKSQLNAYWTTLVFTGKGKPPMTLSNFDAFYLKLIEQPGTIAYMMENEVTNEMRIVYKFP